MINRRQLVLGGAAAVLASRIPSKADGNGFTARSGRPIEARRNFRCPAVEKKIASIEASLASPELAQIFRNCMPNTLDTTVFPMEQDGHPDTYVVTGDIDAMWLRDSSAQVWPYLPFATEDAALAWLIEGVVRRQARLIVLDPYANAFTRNTSDPPLPVAMHDKTEMRPGVAERKWEIDSLCFPVRLAHGFWKATGSRAAFDGTWHAAALKIVATFREQQRWTDHGPYRFQRNSVRPTATLALDGYGNPARPNGLICSGFRPSDDACTFPYFLPANLFAAKALAQLAEISRDVYDDHALAATCLEFSGQVRSAVMRWGIVTNFSQSPILAYEVDGYGDALRMDDANAPGLLSLPYLGLLSQGDPLYQRTRRFAWSLSNPYFFRGNAAEGIGGPHVGLNAIWPMSIIMRALTSSSEREISTSLQTLCTTTDGTYFMHESFNKDDPAKYTRPWFAWANGLFGELILKLDAERPQMLRNWKLSANPSPQRNMPELT
jgi:meiotically up-regulated gene 157 (Mug157) protein